MADDKEKIEMEEKPEETAAEEPKDEEPKDEPVKEEAVEVKEKADDDDIPPHMNRWWVVFGAISIQLALGSIYSWGTLSVLVSSPGWLPEPKTTTIFVFALGLFSFAANMIWAGQLQQKIGPMKTVWIGAVILCIGVMVSAAARLFAVLLITYGIIFGAGIGFGYVCPIAAAARWFPDKKGLINGLAVAGFGAGAFVFNYIIKGVGNPNGVARTDPGYAAEMALRVPTVFIVIGIVETVLVVCGSFFMRLPPDGYKVKGWTPPKPTSGGPSRHNWQRGEIIKTGQFWLLWSLFVLSATSGLMVIGSYASFAQQTKPDDPTQFSYTSLAALDFALVGGMASLFNAMGRIAWGKLCDAFGYRQTMMIMFSIQSALMIAYFFSAASVTLYVDITQALFFCFGGNFSIFPTATTDLFGAKFLGANYGMVFTAYGIAGILGSLLSALVVPVTKDYMAVFITFGVMSFFAAVLSYFLKPLPEPETTNAE